MAAIPIWNNAVTELSLPDAGAFLCYILKWYNLLTNTWRKDDDDAESNSQFSGKGLGPMGSGI